MNLRERIREGDRRGESLGVWLGSLFIEPSYVTRLELVEEKLSKSGKNFDKVSGLLFFWPKEESLRLNGADVIAVTAVNHCCHS